MFKTLEYLKFLFSSSNQHGVHSPFVYDYVTKCLYARFPYKSTKTMTVLLKSMAYLKVTTIGLSPSKENTKDLILSEFPKIQINAEHNDAVYLDIADLGTAYPMASLPVHNHSMGIVDSIHQSKKNKVAWEELKRSPQITVTLDLFYCGVIFFRKEQAKEHFKIRT